MRQRAMAAVGLLMGVLAARPSIAQTTWSDRGRINVDFGGQPSTSTFSGTANIPVYQQTGTLTAT